MLVHIYLKWFWQGKRCSIFQPVFPSPPPSSRAWERKRASGILQPGPAVLRAHSSRRLFPQHLHVHAYFPWRPGLRLPPASPSLPQRRAFGWIRAQRSGGRQQLQERGKSEAAAVVKCDDSVVQFEIKGLYEAAAGSTGYRSIGVHGNRSQLQC